MMSCVSVKNSVPKVSRNPKCARCRNHGFVVQLKGHSGKCQFFSCKCWKCSLITERTKIMATQRRLKKSQRDEIAIKDNLAGLATYASTATVNGIERDEETLPHAAEHRPSKANLRPESGIRMSAGGREADGKTYVELGVAACAVKEHTISPAVDGTIDVDVGEGRSAGSVYGVHDVLTMNRNPDDQIQKNVYVGERMSFPLHVYSYPCPAILVNLQPPVSFKDPFTFPHPHPGGLAYAADPASLPDCRMPLFTPYSMPRSALMEDFPGRHHLYYPQNVERASGGGRLLSRAELPSEKLQGSQGSDILSVDDSSQETA